MNEKNIKSKKILKFYIDVRNGQKRCSGCKKTKDINEFRIELSKNHPIRFRYRCKQCDYDKKDANPKPKRIERNGVKLKRCCRCKRYKPLDKFKKHSQKNDGLNNYCKKCNKIETWAYFQLIKDTPEYKAQNKKSRLKRIDYIKSYQKKKRQEPESKRKRNKYERDKRKNDLGYKFLTNSRNAIVSAIKGNIKSGHTTELLGCSIPFFLDYIKSKWTEGMNENNYGIKDNQWSIDHYLPIALFDMSDPKQQKICFHYSNLQPLWFVDNNAKKDRLPNGQYAYQLSKERKLEYLRSLGHDV